MTDAHQPTRVCWNTRVRCGESRMEEDIEVRSDEATTLTASYSGVHRLAFYAFPNVNRRCEKLQKNERDIAPKLTSADALIDAG